MKLLIAIVQDEDAGRLISGLLSEGFSATKLATTGGFLRSGNTTLLLGVEEDRCQRCLEIIEKIGKSRRQIAANPVTLSVGGEAMTSFPMEVTVGGATVFILSVEQFIKY